MSIWFDEKGKFFTDVISKEAIPVIIQTLTHRVQGCIYVRPGQRFKDEINQSELFIAITEATIFEHSGKELYRCDFLALNRDQIIWMLPQDQLQNKTKTEKGGGS